MPLLVYMQESRTYFLSTSMSVSVHAFTILERKINNNTGCFHIFGLGSILKKKMYKHITNFEALIDGCTRKKSITLYQAI